MERTAGPNSHHQPQAGEHPEGSTKEVCVSIFGHVKDLEIRNGEFPLVSASTGMFNCLCQMSQNHANKISYLSETDELSITGGFFPVGNFR